MPLTCGHAAGSTHSTHRLHPLTRKYRWRHRERACYAYFDLVRGHRYHPCDSSSSRCSCSPTRHACRWTPARRGSRAGRQRARTPSGSSARRRPSRPRAPSLEQVGGGRPHVGVDLAALGEEPRHRVGLGAVGGGRHPDAGGRVEPVARAMKSAYPATAHASTASASSANVLTQLGIVVAVGEGSFQGGDDSPGCSALLVRRPPFPIPAVPADVRHVQQLSGVSRGEPVRDTELTGVHRVVGCLD